MTTYELIVRSDEVVSKTRIDAYLTDNFPDFSRSFIQKIIKDGNVFVNDKKVKANYIIKEGDVVKFNVEEPKELEVLPQKIPLNILYEDDDYIVVFKPKGMVVHPAAGNPDGTLVNALMYHAKGKLSDINGVLRPGIVHRIDKDTEGILVVAKNSESHRKLTDQFKVHSITRRYHAIVCGNIEEDEGTVDAPLGRSDKDRKKMAITEKNSKRAVTHFKVLKRFGNYTYIECTLETGRTHQIRVHMASLHHPLLGDSIYGNKENEFGIEGQVLLAKVLGFNHPTTNEYVEYEVDLTDNFKDVLKKIENKYGEGK
ncbi:MAG: RluA family pseudouridine synthase [Clostridia bacterium]|nr:RluA family pseudouridine synthase [Clostridia bacterium]